jgi:hypothetical protein
MSCAVYMCFVVQVKEPQIEEISVGKISFKFIILRSLKSIICTKNVSRRKVITSEKAVIIDFIVDVENKKLTLKLIRRHEWLARDPKNPPDAFGEQPAQFVVISECSTTSPCVDVAEGCSNMKILQQWHMDDRGWP